MTGPWAPLLVRPDDAPSAGAGHVMRTLALVERWAATGPAYVALASGRSRVARRVEAAGGRVVEVDDDGSAAGLRRLLGDLRPAWAVLDGYRFGTDVQRAVRGTGTRLAVVDDHGHHGAYAADLVVDQNLGGAPGAVADRPDGAAALLGPRYALVREEFRAPRPTAYHGTTRVVVTLGGSAADRAEGVADRLAADLAASGLEVDVTTPLRSGARDRMGGLLGAATLVVSAAGTTTWELCALGRPAVLVAVAGNQEPVGQAMGEAGAARYLGRLDALAPCRLADEVRALLTEPAARTALAGRAAALVDGAGVDRVVTELRSSLVGLRTAGDGDRELLWEWVNDPEVRASAWRTEPIPWEEHRRWWEAAGCGRHQYVAEHRGVPWGQVRFDVDERGVAAVDVSVAATCRGRGAAAPLVRAGVRRLFAETGCVAVVASVRPDNERSRRAFLAADFTPWPAASAGDGCTLTYLRGRDGRH